MSDVEDRERTDSPLDLQPHETVCPDCFTIRAASGACLC